MLERNIETASEKQILCAHAGKAKDLNAGMQISSFWSSFGRIDATRDCCTCLKRDVVRHQSQFLGELSFVNFDCEKREGIEAYVGEN